MSISNDLQVRYLTEFITFIDSKAPLAHFFHDLNSSWSLNHSISRKLIENSRLALSETFNDSTALEFAEDLQTLEENLENKEEISAALTILEAKWAREEKQHEAGDLKRRIYLAINDAIALSIAKVTQVSLKELYKKALLPPSIVQMLRTAKKSLHILSRNDVLHLFKMLKKSSPTERELELKWTLQTKEILFRDSDIDRDYFHGIEYRAYLHKYLNFPDTSDRNKLLVSCILPLIPPDLLRESLEAAIKKKNTSIVELFLSDRKAYLAHFQELLKTTDPEFLEYLLESLGIFVNAGYIEEGSSLEQEILRIDNFFYPHVGGIKNLFRPIKD